MRVSFYPHRIFGEKWQKGKPPPCCQHCSFSRKLISVFALAATQLFWVVECALRSCSNDFWLMPRSMRQASCLAVSGSISASMSHCVKNWCRSQILSATSWPTTILIYRQETAVSQDTYRMADAGLGIAHVSGKINRADHTMPLVEHQYRSQVIFARCMQLHRCAWVVSFDRFWNSPASITTARTKIIKSVTAGARNTPCTPTPPICGKRMARKRTKRFVAL